MTNCNCRGCWRRHQDNLTAAEDIEGWDECDLMYWMETGGSPGMLLGKGSSGESGMCLRWAGHAGDINRQVRCRTRERIRDRRQRFNSKGEQGLKGLFRSSSGKMPSQLD